MGFRIAVEEAAKVKYVLLPQKGDDAVVERDNLVEQVFHGELDGLHAQVECKEKIPVALLPVGDQLLYVRVVLAAWTPLAVSSIGDEIDMVLALFGDDPLSFRNTVFKLFHHLGGQSGIVLDGGKECFVESGVDGAEDDVFQHIEVQLLLVGTG